MLKVMVVDDAMFMRGFLKKIIKSLGHSIVGEAGNGRTAFEVYKEVKPDLVMLDVTMDDVTGLECLKMIKEFDQNAKVVMCSAMGQDGIVTEAIQYGAMDFVVKPFQADRIEKVLKKAEGLLDD